MRAPSPNPSQGPKLEERAGRCYLRDMELSERLARLEGEVAAVEARSETRQAEYRTDIARLAEDMAKRDTEAAKRDTRLLLAVAGMFSLAVIVLGLLIRLP